MSTVEQILSNYTTKMNAIKASEGDATSIDTDNERKQAVLLFNQTAEQLEALRADLEKQSNRLTHDVFTSKERAIIDAERQLFGDSDKFSKNLPKYYIYDSGNDWFSPKDDKLKKSEALLRVYEDGSYSMKLQENEDGTYTAATYNDNGEEIAKTLYIDQGMVCNDPAISAKGLGLISSEEMKIGFGKRLVIGVCTLGLSEGLVARKNNFAKTLENDEYYDTFNRRVYKWNAEENRFDLTDKCSDF